MQEKMEKYPALTINRKTGEETFIVDGHPLPFKLIDFWQWSSSDLVGNALRGVMAEYIVTTAVGSKEKTRTEWDAYDVETPERIKVEIKSSAYFQSWAQKKLSTIQFNIRPTRGWDAKTNTYSLQQERQSDVYVFCVLEHKNKETINPLDISQWVFYVIGTPKLNKAADAQKTITLSMLLKLEPKKVKYGEIHEAIKLAVSIGS